MSAAGDELFPVDILTHIFTRLPLKSLAACQSTCKFWRRLIASPCFVRSYNQSSATNPMILFESLVAGSSPLVCADPFPSLSPLSLAFLGDRVRIRASCNGLLCCSSVPTKGLFYVCNPLTSQFRVINRSPFGRSVSRFHVNDDPMLVGLAAEPARGRVRVVLAGYHRPFGCRPNNPLVGHVFDSDTNAWTRIQTVSHDDFGYMNKKQVVFVNGCLHWLTKGFSHLLVLDLEHEVWSTILLPDEIGMGAKNFLLELDGALSVVQILEELESMVIWVLKDYYGGMEWGVVDKINLNCIRGMLSSTFPISQSGGFIFLATHNCVLMYDRSCKKWRGVFSIGKNIGCPLWFAAFPFRSMIFPL